MGCIRGREQLEPGIFDKPIKKLKTMHYVVKKGDFL